MVSRRAERALVLLRIPCILFCTAAFAAAASAPSWFTPFEVMMVAMVAQVGWSVVRLYYQVACLWFGHAAPQPDRNTLMILAVEWVLMLPTFGTAWAAVAVAVYLTRQSHYCRRSPGAAALCHRYAAASAFALVARYLSLAIAVVSFWVEGRSRHASN